MTGLGDWVEIRVLDEREWRCARGVRSTDEEDGPGEGVTTAGWDTTRVPGGFGRVDGICGRDVLGEAL